MNKLLRNTFLYLFLALSVIAPAFSQGTTVIGGLGPGLGQSVNPFDPGVQRQANINNLISQAATTNAANTVAYLKAAADWVTNAVHARDLGQPIPAVPAPPQVIHVDPNTGVQTSGPDLVATPPVLPAPVGNTGSNGLIANPNPAPDRIDQIMQGLSQMWTVLSQQSADIAKIKAKLGVQ